MSVKRPPLRSDWVGSVIGLLVFAAGIGLLVLTFQQAFTLFSVPTQVAMGASGKTIDLYVAGQSFASLVIRVLLLLVMCVVGSVVANRGIRLYVSCRAPAPPKEEPEKPHGGPVEGEAA